MVHTLILSKQTELVRQDCISDILVLHCGLTTVPDRNVILSFLNVSPKGLEVQKSWKVNQFYCNGFTIEKPRCLDLMKTA